MTPLLALALFATAQAGPNAPKDGPPPSELAKLYFIAGDLLRANEAVQAGAPRDPKCQAMVKPLADYMLLASRKDRLTAAEAKQFIAADRAVSPLAMSKVTRSVYERFVGLPLLKAKARVANGLNADALTYVREALDADPNNAEAAALLLKLAPDAGTAADAGR